MGKTNKHEFTQILTGTNPVTGSIVAVANLNQGETLYIPITVTSLTAHNIPSGTSFSREAWIEALVEHDGEIIYSSGLIDSNTSILDKDEEDLLLFTSFFFALLCSFFTR